MYSKSYKTFCGKDVIDKVINNLLNNSKYCCRVIEKEFDTPLFISKKFIKDLQKKKLNNGFVKNHMKKLIS